MDNRKKFIFSSVVIIVVCVPLLIGSSIHYTEESNHHIWAECNVSNCFIENVTVCTRRNFRHKLIEYTCYSGSFDYTLINTNYTKYHKFNRWQDECHNNTIIPCTYDNRNVKKSLSLVGGIYDIGSIICIVIATTIILLYTTVVCVTRCKYNRM